ncbi:signal sequence binding protein [Fomitiporia mediterranea MF3/22]|uniref:signal sequence binding protein n=1 Tax=Fomitiporia mediterranea (strain MF3/22) TaxID=694068 RepID=UPI000440815D|nr:signal sequence binding protein [Fomitiporia mediterranea MF3/22]EJC99110.1 signal sequence binding protein [Fomitiporia mediterranea MF3/22]
MAFKSGLSYAVLLFSLALFNLVHIVEAQGQPEVTYTTFRNFPSRLFFFDDAPASIYFDSIDGIVYVSQDEGKSWKEADIPKGEALQVIEHPSDNQYAFVLTKGTKHYRTSNRGQTWQSFEMPVPPSYVPFPLSFHSDPSNFGYILYQGTKCVRSTFGWGSICHDETYYTTDAFSTTPDLLLSETSRCQFAHSSKDFKHDAHHDLIYCVAFDTTSSTGTHSLSSSRLFASTDFFKNDQRTVDLGIGKNARGVLAFAIVSKFAVVALKDLAGSGDMLLYVSVDAQTWARAHFPHQSSAQLRENAYTIVEGTTHSLGVDVLLHAQATIGTFFVSNSNGTYFVESLRDTNRNDLGFVDFENIYGVEGVGIANVVANAQDVEGRGVPKQLQSRITFDDGSTWTRLTPPDRDTSGSTIGCNPSDQDACSLHLHSVTAPHNFGRIFSSPAPGLVLAVGSVGPYLKPYEECDTFLSTDAGITWKMVSREAHKYEFGDQGSIMVLVNDEDGVNEVRYTSDLGRSWTTLTLDHRFRARALTTVPDSTSQKFMLVGQLARKDQTGDGRFVVIYLDFAPTRNRQCGDNDFERWYARSGSSSECIMGHKQWYRRRKPDADCYVGHKFDDPVEHEDNCPCTDADYECDYNFIRNGDQCVPAGPEPIPAGTCNDPNGKYMGSSGYRLIPGNTCDQSRGKKNDNPVEKDCSQAQPEEGEVTHQTFEFASEIAQYAYFKESTTILVRLHDGSIWQSSNEGYSWNQLFPDERFVVFYLHTYSHDRGYLLTASNKFYYTTDTGKNWHSQDAPSPPNTFGAVIMHFHPNSEYIIWTGDVDCTGNGNNCHSEARFSTDNGRNWHFIESYVRNCAWARDKELKIDSSQIICESYKEKQGNQRLFNVDINPLQLVGGAQFYRNKQVIFDRVVGFAKFSEFLIVAEYLEEQRALDLQVSLDGKNFAAGVFPPTLRPQNHAYTILESSTKAVFMHLTTSEFPAPYWGAIMKSNGNGTYFGVSADYVNRNDRGYVDFEKMINLDGIALINVVSNPQEAVFSGRKKLQSRITHNDGGTWKPLMPPSVDSHGQSYDCSSTKCGLQIHGYTERFDTRATYSSPSVPGLVMAVGNVGEKLAPYGDSDTFLSRDAGFSWQEIHKDAHLWEFGDYGSILVIANDEEPTDHVLFSTDEGLTWREYKFSEQEKVRVKSIVTVPQDTSRRFILFGFYPRSISSAVAIHLDFSSLTRKQCVLDPENPGQDDFEWWSPAEQRQERCLFGRQTLYHRRIRDRNCYVGKQQRIEEKFVENCQCSDIDFECEFNHVRNDAGECVLVPGATPLPDDDSCPYGEEYWYERTAYRKIPYSSCEGGQRPDRGTAHLCPGLRGHGFFFWVFVLFVPIALAGLVGYWIYRRSGLARGTIRLPGPDLRPAYSNSSFLDTLASVPWFIIGLAGIAWERISLSLPFGRRGFRARSGYRHVPVDEDAQVLRFEDED